MKTLLILCILALQYAAQAKLKVLIVYGHQEPKSFCAAMKDQCIKTLTDLGHDVQVSDLYALKMFNRLDKTDFTELYDPTYFRPQVEQANANKKNRTIFSEELRREYDKCEWADVFLFVYPYYLSYMPGIVQAWLERLFSYGYAFGPNGDHLAGKRGMLIYTTGGEKKWIEKYENMMKFLIHDRMDFWQMKHFESFPAYAAAYVGYEQRKAYLTELDARMKALT